MASIQMIRDEIRSVQASLDAYPAAITAENNADVRFLIAQKRRLLAELAQTQTEACITAIAGPRVKPNPEQAALMHRARNYGNYVCDTKECLTATYLVALGWLAWSEARPRQIEITAAGQERLG